MKYLVLFSNVNDSLKWSLFPAPPSLQSSALRENTLRFLQKPQMKLHLCKALHCTVVRGFHCSPVTDGFGPVSICSKKDKDREKNIQNFYKIIYVNGFISNRATNKKSGVTVLMGLHAGKSCFLCTVTLSHGWGIARRVTWNGDAISHGVSTWSGTRRVHMERDTGCCFPAQCAGDAQRGAGRKGSAGYTLGGLFIPTCGNLKNFSLPLSSCCSFPPCAFQITELGSLWVAPMGVTITGGVCGLHPMSPELWELPSC